MLSPPSSTPPPPPHIGFLPTCAPRGALCPHLHLDAPPRPPSRTGTASLLLRGLWRGGCPLLFARPFGEQSQPCRGDLEGWGGPHLPEAFWGGADLTIFVFKEKEKKKNPQKNPKKTPTKPKLAVDRTHVAAVLSYCCQRDVKSLWRHLGGMGGDGGRGVLGVCSFFFCCCCFVVF